MHQLFLVQTVSVKHLCEISLSVFKNRRKVLRLRTFLLIKTITLMKMLAQIYFALQATTTTV